MKEAVAVCLCACKTAILVYAPVLFRGKLSVTSFSGDENGVDAGDRRF